MRNRQENVVYENNKLIDSLTPMGLDFRKTNIQIGDMLSEIMVIYKYPSTVSSAWLSRLSKMAGVTVNTHIQPTSSIALISALEDQMKRVGTKLAGSGMNKMTEERLKKEEIDILELRKVIEESNEKVVLMTVTVMIRAHDKDTLDSLKTRVKSVASGNGLLLKPIAFKQQESLKTVSPYFQHESTITESYSQTMPLRTACASFPFNNSGINHGKGYLLGKDAGGGILLVDFWKRDGDITNSNFTVLGVAGVGKSATVKKILLQAYAQGVKIIILDPEREYKELCEALGGSWINLGGGSGGRINPYQIKDLPMEEKDDLYEEGEKIETFANGETNPVRLHFQFIRTLHRIRFKSLTDSELELLEEVTEKTYEKFNINYDTDTSKLKPEDYPLMLHIYETNNEMLQNPSISETMKVRHENISLAMRSGAVGADSHLWNGTTTVKADDDFIVLDTYDLQNSDIDLRRTQTFNACTWIAEQGAKNREEEVFAIIDEAYLMADPEVPQGLMFLRDWQKRGRKYSLGMGVISHSVVDFIDPSIKKYGQALLDIPSFKIFMGTDGKNLQEAVEIMNFTDKEADILSKKQRGHAIMYVGSRKVHAMFQMEHWELEMFGTAGGR